MKTFLQILSILMITSCASWRAEETPEVGQYPKFISEESHRPNISLTLKVYDVLENKKLDKSEMTKKDKEEVLKLIENTYKESKLFNIVDLDSPNREMSIEINITRNFNSNLAATILTAATLYMIPRRTTEEITINTRFLDKKGILVGMVEKTDNVIVWHQFFMIFAMPFNIPGNVIEDTIADLNRSTIVEAHSDSYFKEIND